MSDRLHDALHDCLEALLAGADLETAISRHPELASELRPLLEAAQAARGEDAPTPRGGQRRSRARFMRRARRAAQAEHARPFWAALPRTALTAALAVLLAIIGGVGLVAVSAQSLPGDALYPLKRAAEDARIRFSPGQRNKAAIAIRHDERRLEEVRRMLQQGRTGPVQFEGDIDRKRGDLWHIGDVPVLVTGNTRLDEVFKAGDFVRVLGLAQEDGWVLAQEIQAAGTVLTGELHASSEGGWTLDGIHLYIFDPSRVGAVEAGQPVRITIRQAAGSSVAHQIVPLSPTPTSTPAPTASPSPTPPSSTPTSRPSTATAEPTEGTSTAGEELEFTGIVESKEPNRWRVDDQWVRITADTEIEGNPQVGDGVRVEAEISGEGLLTAEEIEVLIPTETAEPTETEEPADDEGEEHKDTDDDEEEEEEEDFRIFGEVTAKNGEIWTVDGQSVHLTNDTEIDGDPQVGDTVRVDGLRQEDGTLIAEKIKRED